MRQLTSVDAQFFAVEDGASHGHFSGIAIYEPADAPGGKLTIETLRRIVAERIHLMPPFRWRLVEVPLGLDLPYWVEVDEVDIEYHVRESRLRRPGDDRALARHAEKIIATPLDRSRPLWEVHLVQGLQGGRVALVTKIHHSASDGVGGAELYSILHDPTPEVRSPFPAPSPSGSRVPGSTEMLARGVLGLPRQPVRFARSLPRALPHLDQVPNIRSLPGVPTASGLARKTFGVLSRRDGDLLEQPYLKAPRTKLNGRITGGRRIAFGDTPLEEIKAIKNRFGVTVNDVVMTIVTGGLRSWLQSQEDLPNRPLVSFVPVSVRTREERGRYGNRIAMMAVALPTDEPDALARLRATHEAMRSAKERHRAVPATVLQDSNHFIPPILLARAARATAAFASGSRGQATGNLLMSNVPGPRTPEYLGGARWVGIYPASAIFHGIGLNITVISYVDQMKWGVVCDRAQVDDAWPLMDAMHAAQAELAALT